MFALLALTPEPRLEPVTWILLLKLPLGSGTLGSGPPVVAYPVGETGYVLVFTLKLWISV